MDELAYGIRDKRGNWRPKDPIEPAPLFTEPWRVLKLLRWLPHYFLPWNAIFFLSAAAFWYWLTPSAETTSTLAWGWIAYLLVRNIVAVFLFYGAFELRLYIRRSQGTLFKYNPKWPDEKSSSVFLFRSQSLDSMIRCFGTGVPIWTAYEVLVLWAWSNGWGSWTTFAENPWALVIIGICALVFHEFHFFTTHRMIHIPFLYRHVHSVHHNSVNPSPWSSLSMHPVEHLIYFSGVLIHFVLPSHPMLAIYHLHLAGFGAVIGHIGFEKIVATDEKAMDTHAFAHYLHHKYFEVNYSDGLIPLDKWFGTWHDGTERGDAMMNARMQKRRQKQTRKKGKA